MLKCERRIPEHLQAEVTGMQFVAVATKTVLGQNGKHCLLEVAGGGALRILPEDPRRIGTGADSGEQREGPRELSFVVQHCLFVSH